MISLFRAAVPIAGLLLVISQAADAADPAAGQAVFKTQCGVCHPVVQGKNLAGPSLFGIVGQASGAVEGFRYSPANKSANLTWDAETLDKYLISPKALMPGTTMPYAGLKDAEKRADLIAYLETLH